MVFDARSIGFSGSPPGLSCCPVCGDCCARLWFEGCDTFRASEPDEPVLKLGGDLKLVCVLLMAGVWRYAPGSGR